MNAEVRPKGVSCGSNSPAGARKIKTHDLKCWPIFFEAIKRGDKRFEIRLNDREYQVGDLLRLHFWDEDRQEYDHMEGVLEHRVTYIMYGPKFGIAKDWCIMSLS
jgi:hypothetical protein